MFWSYTKLAFIIAEQFFGKIKKKKHKNAYNALKYKDSVACWATIWFLKNLLLVFKTIQV